MKLNGWHRLWILLSASYFILVTSYVILEFPKAKDIPHQSVLYKKLSKKSAGMIWPATHEDALALGVEVSDLYKEAVAATSVKPGLPDYVKAAIAQQKNSPKDAMASTKGTWRDAPLVEPASTLQQTESSPKDAMARTWRDDPIVEPASTTQAQPNVAPAALPELPDNVLKALSWEHYQNALKDGRQIDFHPIIEMPNKHIIEFKNKASKDDMNAASKEYWLGVEEKTTEKRLHFLFYAFLSWVIPCVLLYVAGRSIHWVYCGFRQDID